MAKKIFFKPEPVKATFAMLQFPVSASIKAACWYAAQVSDTTMLPWKTKARNKNNKPNTFYVSIDS